MSCPRVLRFGIRSLDELIGRIEPTDSEQVDFGIDLSEPQDLSEEPLENDHTSKGGDTQPLSSSVCITGPDGTGKSVFSLHMASRYLADCIEATNGNSPKELPKVLYISTDLTYKMALKAWNNFALDQPFNRREPLIELKEGRTLHPQTNLIELRQYFPSTVRNSDQNIIKYLEPEAGTSPLQVCFVDLASRTAGDDWGFVHRLLSILEGPERGRPRNLVVLDAVEGFETLVGDFNAFGEKSSRRSRIAQAMRLATGKSHMLFVIEEGRDERFPEEFVTDVVIRLRNIKLERYLRRTVEVEKARGQWHIRGQHPFVIRDGKKGSTTGDQANADDPEVEIGSSPKKLCQSYVHVFPSLDYMSRETMIDKKEHNPRPHRRDKFAAFGITYLDNMLGSRSDLSGNDPNLVERDIDSPKLDGGDPSGLPCSSVTALIGDPLTQKSQLSRAFLSRGFLPYAKALAECKRTGGREADIRVDPPFALMFTTQIMDTVESLTEDSYKWLKDVGSDLKGHLHDDFEQQLKAHIASNLICRRFEIHDIPGPILMHIFHRNIEKAQRMVFQGLHKTYPATYSQLDEVDPLPAPPQRFKESWRIRVVIDDLNGFRNTFPEMREDPLMLPMLLFLLNREGVTTLIIDTQTSGSPELSITERFDSSVRELVEHRIYTWRLPFYGENRVAISLIPPISNDYRGIIRELRWDTQRETSAALASMVDPNFELYMGLESGQPQPVPLQVRLFAETPTFKRYIETEEKLFREVFVPVPCPTNPEGHRVITWAEASEYDSLRDSSHLQRDTRIEHTAILQVDEFWWLRRAKHRRTGAFRSQWNYMNAVTAKGTKGGFEADLVVDPFEVFQPPTPNANDTKTTGEKRRLDFFDEQCGYKLEQFNRLNPGDKECIDRVPFTWDFGFLLCNETAWQEAADLEISKRDDPKFQVSDLVNATILVKKLSEKNQPISRHVADKMTRSGWKAPTGQLTKKHKEQLVKSLNELLEDSSLHDNDETFRLLEFSAETRELRRQGPKPEKLARFNRLLLEDSFPDEIARHQPRVRHVWERLRKVGRNSKRQVSVSWREFLAASKVVAENQSYRTSTPATAFDFTMLMPEAFSCLILEMWVSEIYDSLGRRTHQSGNDDFATTREHLLDRLRQRRWRWAQSETQTGHTLDPKSLLVSLTNEKTHTLEQILQHRLDEQSRPGSKKTEPASKSHHGGYSLELYKVWLLLVETLNFPELVDSSSHLNFEFKSRDTSAQAVAARHWYKTASSFIDSLTPEQLENNWIPVRLPGHFSVRADWFLAVAGGSRSNRLADHALDLLCSKRSNVTRLQEGIGLPTRKLFDEDADLSRLRTRLISIPEPGKPLANVEYDDLRQIGASSLLFASDVVDPAGLIEALSKSTDPTSLKDRISGYLCTSILSGESSELIERLKRPNTKDKLGVQSAHTEPSAEEKRLMEKCLRSLVKDLNKYLNNERSRLVDLKELAWTESDLKSLSAETRMLLGQDSSGVDPVLLNRMVLEDVYSKEILINRFHWLWRSGIWAYNRHSRIWQKWLNRMLLWWHSLRQRYGSNWTSGFDVYDLITEIESGRKHISELRKMDLKSWTEFHEMRDVLIAELEQVTTLRPDVAQP